MTTSIFGPLVTGEVVENDLKAHLQKWLPTYLAQLARDRGLTAGSIPLPKLWLNTTEFDTGFNATNLPAILIICTGLAGRPEREGDGSYRAAWVVGVGVLVSAGGDNARRNSDVLAKRYAGAILWAIMQYKGLGTQNVTSVDWEDLGYDDVPSEDQDSLSSARLVFTIEYRDVINDVAGPGAPDPLPDPNSPYPAWGQVQDLAHVGVTVKNNSGRTP